MTDRLISEQAVMESLTKEYNQKRTGDGLKLTWIEKAVSATPTASDWDRYSTALWREAYERGKRDGQSSAQPNLQSTCNQLATDCISRQAAIEGADKIIERDTSGNNDVVKAMQAWKEWIMALPTAQPEPSQIARDIATIIENEQDMRVILKNAQPERMRGRWFKIDGMYSCGRCGAGLYDMSPFCPMCGADMREGQDG